MKLTNHNHHHNHQNHHHHHNHHHYHNHHNHQNHHHNHHHYHNHHHHQSLPTPKWCRLCLKSFAMKLGSITDLKYPKSQKCMQSMGIKLIVERNMSTNTGYKENLHHK